MGQLRVIPVLLRTRGNLRLDSRVCAFVPLSIEFPKNVVNDTAFDGQRKLKLITHCQEEEDYDQGVLKGYLAYRLFNLITPRSFRVRLAKATYVNSRNGKTMSSHNAVFIEDEDDLARRLEGRAVAMPHTVFVNYDLDALTTMMVFQYMIGNTDFSIYALHNVKIVQTRFRPLYQSSGTSTSAAWSLHPTEHPTRGWGCPRCSCGSIEGRAGPWRPSNRHLRRSGRRRPSRRRSSIRSRAFASGTATSSGSSWRVFTTRSVGRRL